MFVKSATEHNHLEHKYNMSSDTDEDAKITFEALSKAAVLDVLIPKSDAFDAAAVLRGEDGSPEDLQSVPLRRHLFFGIHNSQSHVIRCADWLYRREVEATSHTAHLKLGRDSARDRATA